MCVGATWQVRNILQTIFLLEYVKENTGVTNISIGKFDWGVRYVIIFLYVQFEFDWVL